MKVVIKAYHLHSLLLEILFFLSISVTFSPKNVLDIVYDVFVRDMGQ
jgi:hypothetical protein